MMPVYLFVYGTLRRGASADLTLSHPNDVRWSSTGWVPGHLFRVSYYPGLQLHAKGQAVIGDLFELHHPDKTLSVLDEFEACSLLDPQPHEYVRQLTEVQRHGASSVLAWVYVYNRSTHALDVVTSGDFLNS